MNTAAVSLTRNNEPSKPIARSSLLIKHFRDQLLTSVIKQPLVAAYIYDSLNLPSYLVEIHTAYLVGGAPGLMGGVTNS